MVFEPSLDTTKMQVVLGQQNVIPKDFSGRCAEQLCCLRGLPARRLASGYGADDEEGFFAGCDGFGQWCLGRFVREILFAGEEADESAASASVMISDGAAQHRVTAFKCVQDGALCNGPVNFQGHFAINAGQIPQMNWQFNAYHFASLFRSS